MKYKIEKNIKIPARGGQPGELNKVIRQMQPGDSIVVGSKKERDTFAAICYRLNYAFASRKIDNTKNFRCWLKPKQDLEKQKKRNIPQRPQTKKAVLLGDDGFIRPHQISGDLPEDIEPRGVFPQEILNEAIQRSKEPLSLKAYETNDWVENKNDFKHHDENGDGRPLDFND